ncbi:MAG: hypothetical protein HY399_06875 [Elusimicrobia bacterium]|nr:hypothetical protein [Elusimicrobiota bacterium]
MYYSYVDQEHPKAFRGASIPPRRIRILSFPILPDIDEIPVAKAVDLMGEFSQGFHLLEAKEFIKYFNHFAETKKIPSSWRISRRTLQFYSSPQIRLMPLPAYRNGHKSHYLYPDHINRLFAIQKLKEKFFFPLWLIREIIGQTPGEFLIALEHIDIPPNELLDMLPLVKKIALARLLRYEACQALVRYGNFTTSMPQESIQNIKDPAEKFRQETLFHLEGLEQWLLSYDALETHKQIWKQNHNPEVEKLVRKIQEYKKKLMRRRG